MRAMKAKNLKPGNTIDLTPILEWFERKNLGPVEDVDKFTAECEYALIESVEFEDPNIVVLSNQILNVAIPQNFIVEVANA